MHELDLNLLFQQAVAEEAQRIAAQYIAAERESKPEQPVGIAPNGEVVKPFLVGGEFFLKAKQACTLLDVKYPTIWRWSNSGVLPRVKVGGRVYYRYSDVQKLMMGGGGVTDCSHEK